MEKQLEDLLEYIDKNYPNSVLRKELSTQEFLPQLIDETLNNGLIVLAASCEGTGVAYELDMGYENMPLILNSSGFLMLNQIRLKKATEKLNDSIIKFDESTTQYNNKITALTMIMIFFALLQTAFAIVTYFKLF